MTNPVIYHDKMAWPVLDAWRTSAATQLGLIGRPVVEFGIVAGAAHPPADRCSCTGPGGAQGVGWVRIIDQHLSEYVSLRDGPPIDNQPCNHDVWIVDAEVGVYRCWPGLTGSGTKAQLPSADTVTTAARGIVDDLAALRRSLLCNEYLRQEDIGWYNARATTLGPTGNCIGAVISASFSLMEPGCPAGCP